MLCQDLENNIVSEFALNEHVLKRVKIEAETHSAGSKFWRTCSRAASLGRPARCDPSEYHWISDPERMAERRAMAICFH